MRYTILILAVLVSCKNQAQDVEPDIKLKLKESEDGWLLQGNNTTYAYIDLLINDEKLDSVISQVIIEPMDSVIITNLGEGDRATVAEAFNEKHSIDYFLGGDPATVKHDDNYLYSLPFKKGKKYSVSQGPNGKFSHNNAVSKYAIDFQLEIGEPVHAAREGIVVKVQENYTKAGGKEFLWKANRIIILHEDGTTASYVHLDYNGSLVEEGERVEKGQLIGRSGNTGFTRGPHLHFVVRKEKDLAIPVYFEGYEGIVLKQRKRYKR
ncbi:MAG: M23 family metallopeptidase [Bacteroidota bacterium]